MSNLHGVLSTVQARGAPTDIIDTALETVRRHLGMEVAYLSEFVGDRTVFRAVSAPGLDALIKPGDSRALTEVYCGHILDGSLPRLIRDTRDEPLAMSMPITGEVPIGSHVSVPIRRADGSVFGMFCCLSPRPNASLGPRDLDVMELFASISAEQVNTSLAERARLDRILAATQEAMAADGFVVVYQPIFELDTLVASGFEALCRFRSTPPRSPDKWFAEAAEVGLAEALECMVADRALAALDRLPGNVYVSINAAPGTVESGALARVLDGRDLARVVLEVTEQAVVSDYDRIAFRLDGLRDQGLRLAVDDAGAGYAGLQQILRLRPDLIKLDMSLTRDVDTDNARASLADAMVSFARKTGALVIAEGIETDGELAALRRLGVARGQGYLLGRPGPLEQAAALAQVELVQVELAQAVVDVA